MGPSCMNLYNKSVPSPDCQGVGPPVPKFSSKSTPLRRMEARRNVADSMAWVQMVRPSRANGSLEVLATRPSYSPTIAEAPETISGSWRITESSSRMHTHSTSSTMAAMASLRADAAPGGSVRVVRTSVGKRSVYSSQMPATSVPQD